MTGKVCLVTGATSGIGAVTAQALAAMGAIVVLVGRRPDRGAEVRDKIRRETGSQWVDFIPTDLSVQSKVRELAGEFLLRYHRLDVLVNDAGAIFTTRKLSQDGIEMTFALNHLSYFLLTNLLIDILKLSAPSRIVNVASVAHVTANIDFDDLQGAHGYNPMKAYGQSKLANVLFTYQLARRLEGSGVTVNALNPGFVATNFGKNNGPLARWAISLGQMFAERPEKGAETSIYLATSPDVDGITGKYFVKKKAVASSPESHNEEVARHLWEVSAQMTGLEERSTAAI
jgi:retinol dehydrogenase-14